MNSRQIDDILNDYLDGDLSPDKRAELEKMITGSPELQTRLKDMKRLKQTLGGIEVTDPGEAYFNDVTERILARIDSKPNVPVNSVNDIRRGHEIIKVLIRLAAIITLLFASFYLSTLKEHSTPVKWTQDENVGKYILPDTIERAFEVDDENTANNKAKNDKKDETSGEKIR